MKGANQVDRPCTIFKAILSLPIRFAGILRPLFREGTYVKGAHITKEANNPRARIYLISKTNSTGCGIDCFQTFFPNYERLSLLLAGKYFFFSFLFLKYYKFDLGTSYY